MRTELAHLLFVTENVEPSHQTNIALCNIDQLFQSLRSQHEWGAKTPFAIAAQYGLPQSLVMELISLKRLSYIDVVSHSLNSVVAGQSTKAREQKVIGPDDVKRSVLKRDLVLCPSRKRDMKDYEFELIIYQCKIRTIYVLGEHSLIRYRNMLKNLDKHIVLILEGSCVEQNEQHIKCMKNCDVIALPPTIAKSVAFGTYYCKSSLSNPFEAVLDQLNDTGETLLFIYGMDGEDESLRIETEELFNIARQSGHEVVSLNDSKYRTDLYSVFSDL